MATDKLTVTHLLCVNVETSAVAWNPLTDIGAPFLCIAPLSSIASDPFSFSASLGPSFHIQNKKSFHLEFSIFLTITCIWPLLKLAKSQGDQRERNHVLSEYLSRKTHWSRKGLVGGDRENERQRESCQTKLLARPGLENRQKSKTNEHCCFQGASNHKEAQELIQDPLRILQKGTKQGSFWK